MNKEELLKLIEKLPHFRPQLTRNQFYCPYGDDDDNHEAVMEEIDSQMENCRAYTYLSKQDIVEAIEKAFRS